MPAAASKKTDRVAERPGVDPRYLVLARVVLTVAEHATFDELCEWAESLGLASRARASAMEGDELTARLLLFLFEAEQNNINLVEVPSREDLAAELYPPPRGLAPPEEIRERQRVRVDVDGKVLGKPFSALEIRFLDTLHTRLRLDAMDDTKFDYDDDLRAQEIEKVRKEVLESAEAGEDERIASVHRESGSAVGDVIDPGPMASFFSLSKAKSPWSRRSDEPWERPRGKQVNVRRLRRALDAPATVKKTEIDGLGILDPVARARAMLTGRGVPTGMELAVRRFEGAMSGDEVPDVLMMPIDGGGDWDRDKLEGALAPAVESMLLRDVDALGALVETVELVGTRDVEDDFFRAAYLTVARGYRYPRTLPHFNLPNAIDHQDADLRRGDIESIESWSDNKQVRWVLFYSLMRIKGSMDDLRRVRFPKAWIYASQAERDDAFPVGSRAGHKAVKAALDQHVWKPAVGHSSGKHASVFWVVHQFDLKSTEVQQEELTERWGSPYGAGKG